LDGFTKKSGEFLVAFTLPSLPYDCTALEPHMSGETLDLHHGKHHQAYIDKTNELAAEHGLTDRSLVEIVRHARETRDQALFNNAAQAWNHSFFWKCLTPVKTRPSARLAGMVDASFGSFDALVDKLKEEAVAHFASGWAWLVLKGDRLEVTSFHDADTPIAREDVTPLLTIDLWEHAYYVDYRNERPKFLDAVLENILNWDFAAENLDGMGAKRGDLG
jgi:Fe-Mn family superoxide dismutase